MNDDNKDLKIVKGLWQPQATTTHSIGVVDPFNNTKSQEHFVKKYMITEMKQIVDGHQELSWTLLMASVELLGRYVSSYKESILDKNNKYYFRTGLSLLGNKYDEFNTDEATYDLYKFRNNVAHLAFFLLPFSASEKIGGPPPSVY